MNHTALGDTGLKVKVTRVKCAKTVSVQELENGLTYPPQYWSIHSSWVAEEPYCFGGHWVNGKITKVKCAKPISDQLLEKH